LRRATKTATTLICFGFDPALRLALDKGKQFGASQSVMSRLENDILGTSAGQDALDAMITRSTDVLLKRKNKRRLMFIKNREGMGERETFHKLHEKYEAALSKTKYFQSYDPKKIT
jgi:hypothetical protein